MRARAGLFPKLVLLACAFLVRRRLDMDARQILRGIGKRAGGDWGTCRQVEARVIFTLRLGRRIRMQSWRWLSAGAKAEARSSFELRLVLSVDLADGRPKERPHFPLDRWSSVPYLLWQPIARVVHGGGAVQHRPRPRGGLCPKRRVTRGAKVHQWRPQPDGERCILDNI